MAERISPYQAFADVVQAELRGHRELWTRSYAEYAQALTRKKSQLRSLRKGFRIPEPLHCYLTIGESIKKGQTVFDLRFLGQSVGNLIVKADGRRMLYVSKEKAGNSAKFFGYPLGEIKGDDWRAGAPARQFRAFYRKLDGRQDLSPRQPEHMVESALFSELEKTRGAEKTLKYIKPVTYLDNTRFHMKTALAASGAAADRVSFSASGGEIDLFCRFRHGTRSRLTVIEVKDKNESRETFSLAMKQAIAYAVFIRELVRSDSGTLWMALWGMGNQPWAQGFTINAVVAMPKDPATDLSFAGQVLHLGQDQIELHYMAFSDDEKPCDRAGVCFETSLASSLEGTRFEKPAIQKPYQ